MNFQDKRQAPAEIYDAHFVPALFAQWGPIMCAEAEVRPGDHVLDVACGTGALTLAAAEITGKAGSVVGLDANPEMLAVARRKPGRIEWVEGMAEALPFPDERFDAVVSQFGFMFFESKHRSLADMMRVLKPDGHLAVAVCDAIDNSPGYAAFAALLDSLFGTAIGDAFRSPFGLGDADVLLEICREAGIANPEVIRRKGKVRFKSIHDLVATERACVWTLGGMLNDEEFEQLVAEAEAVLRPFAVHGGSIEFDMPSLIIKAKKP